MLYVMCTVTMSIRRFIIMFTPWRLDRAPPAHMLRHPTAQELPKYSECCFLKSARLASSLSALLYILGMRSRRHDVDISR